MADECEEESGTQVKALINVPISPYAEANATPYAAPLVITVERAMTTSPSGSSAATMIGATDPKTAAATAVVTGLS